MIQTSKNGLENQISKKETVLILAFCTTLIVLYISYKPVLKIYPLISQANILLHQKNDKKCNLFKGRWIPDTMSPLYTNYSCPMIPLNRNCFLNGRKNADFLNWKWKPDKCELARFSPEAFLSTVRGKTMAFIGDSLARNHANSLLCLLSTVETPKEIGMDARKDKMVVGMKKFKKFIRQNCQNCSQLSHFWQIISQTYILAQFYLNYCSVSKSRSLAVKLTESGFFVSALQQITNGSPNGNYNLTLDKPDIIWANKLSIMDYVVFSGIHWFPRSHYMYESGNLIGCVYCRESNIPPLGPDVAIRKTIRTAFDEINKCDKCKKIFTIMTTASPQHFENRSCNRTRPIKRDDLNMDRPEWEYRKIQMEELEQAKKLARGNGNKFDVVDVTEMMLMRPDGHPGVHSGSIGKGSEDCVHWCLPGPIDYWSELLFEVIRRG